MVFFVFSKSPLSLLGVCRVRTITIIVKGHGRRQMCEDVVGASLKADNLGLWKFRK